MNIIKQTNLNLFLFIIVFCCSPIQAILASAVPVQKGKTAQTKQQKRVKKKRLKKLKNLSKKRLKKFRTLKTQHSHQVHWLAWFSIIWYGITIPLLIIGLSLAITPLWIAAVVLLCLPVVAFMIFAIILLILLLTQPWG